MFVSMQWRLLLQTLTSAAWYRLCPSIPFASDCGFVWGEKKVFVITRELTLRAQFVVIRAFNVTKIWRIHDRTSNFYKNKIV